MSYDTDERRRTDDTVFAELLLDDRVVGDGDAGAVNLGVTALVDEFADGFEVDLAVGDVRLDEGEHLLGGLGDADKDTVVDLEEAEELKDFLGLGGDLRDTARELSFRTAGGRRRTPSAGQRSRPSVEPGRKSHQTSATPA